MSGHTFAADRMPTCTCTPKITICRPHHWVRSIRVAYRCPSLTSWSSQRANGCDPPP